MSVGQRATNRQMPATSSSQLRTLLAFETATGRVHCEAPPGPPPPRGAEGVAGVEGEADGSASGRLGWFFVFIRACPISCL